MTRPKTLSSNTHPDSPCILPECEASLSPTLQQQSTYAYIGSTAQPTWQARCIGQSDTFASPTGITQSLSGESPTGPVPGFSSPTGPRQGFWTSRKPWAASQRPVNPGPGAADARQATPEQTPSIVTVWSQHQQGSGNTARPAGCNSKVHADCMPLHTEMWWLLAAER